MLTSSKYKFCQFLIHQTNESARNIFHTNIMYLYCVDLEVWSKVAKRARIKCIASKFAHNFECVLQRVNTFSHCVTLDTRSTSANYILLRYKSVGSCYVMECKCARVIYVQS